MKKVVLGCGAVLLLVGLAGAIGAYYFVYRPARAFVASMTQLAEVAELDAKVTNTRTYAPPPDGTLTEAQVRRYVAVQERIHALLGTRAAELEAKYKMLRAQQGESPNLREVVGAYRDVFELIGQAKRAQVEALNAQEFSLEEYGWVKTRFYEAAGVELAGVDFRQLAQQMQNGDFSALAQGGSGLEGDGSPGVPPDPTASVPQVNRSLVAPYKDQMPSWFAYAMFGL